MPPAIIDWNPWLLGCGPEVESRLLHLLAHATAPSSGEAEALPDLSRMSALRASVVSDLAAAADPLVLLIDDVDRLESDERATLVRALLSLAGTPNLVVLLSLTVDDPGDEMEGSLDRIAHVSLDLPGPRPGGAAGDVRRSHPAPDDRGPRGRAGRPRVLDRRLRERHRPLPSHASRCGPPRQRSQRHLPGCGRGGQPCRLRGAGDAAAVLARSPTTPSAGTRRRSCCRRTCGAPRTAAWRPARPTTSGGWIASTRSAAPNASEPADAAVPAAARHPGRPRHGRPAGGQLAHTAAGLRRGDLPRLLPALDPDRRDLQRRPAEPARVRRRYQPVLGDAARAGPRLPPGCRRTAARLPAAAGGAHLRAGRARPGGAPTFQAVFQAADELLRREQRGEQSFGAQEQIRRIVAPAAAARRGRASGSTSSSS